MFKIKKCHVKKTGKRNNKDKNVLKYEEMSIQWRKDT